MTLHTIYDQYADENIVKKSSTVISIAISLYA